MRISDWSSDVCSSDLGRQLGRSDFWDGLQSIDADSRVRIFVEIEDFEDDPDILATLTDYRLSDDADTVRLNYELRARADLDGDPGSDDDFSLDRKSTRLNSSH